MDLVLGILVGALVTGFLIAWALKKEIKYTYHVTYAWENEGTSGFGAMHLTRIEKMLTYADVTSVREFIEEENVYEKVVLINWVPLN